MKKGRLLANAYLVLVFGFLYVPIAVLIAFSFNESKSRTVFTGFTFKWYQNLFHNDMVLKSLGVSLGVAFAAACIATVVGTLAAIGISSMNKRARGAVMAVSYVPVVNPEIITGVSLMLLFVVFNRQVSAALSWLLQREVELQGFGLGTLLIAHITFCLPYVIFNVSPKLRQLDPAVYDAALDLGCNPRQAFFKVVLPQLTPAILSAFLISLTYSIDDFIISYFTSGTDADAAHRHLQHDEEKGQPGDQRAFRHHVRGDFNHHPRGQRRGFRKRAPPAQGRARRGGQAMKHILKAKKRFLCLLLAGALAACLSPAALAAPDGVEVAPGYDYTRFKDAGITLNVYNWGEYISNGTDGSMDVVKEFENLTGIRVNYTTYDTNESLYAKLKSGGGNYDVIIPSDYMIGKMAAEGMLEELDPANIPNAALIGEAYRSKPFDPQNKYSVAYTWGLVCIVYNRTMVDEGDLEQGWGILWDEKYAGQVLMFNNSRDAFAIAGKLLGNSINPGSVQEIEQAAEKLKEQKSVVQSYVMDEVFDKMGGGEAALAPYYVGDGVTMMADNPDLAMFIPAEGTNIYIDAMCIPKGSRNKEAAEMFINFMCETQVALANAEYICYSSPQVEVPALLDEETRENEMMYPGADMLSLCETMLEVLPDELNTP